ncbi:MAG: ADP-ribosylglycohydrolase family protein [Planctomycetes bacterium]|nr:ADP-ribosylglycohydrolase family protein [Planctomycetota bacterium]
MNTAWSAAAGLLVCVVFLSAGARAEETTVCRRLPVQEFRDKMKAGWIGQMAGVSWGAPTEFRYRDEIMPESAVPQWRPGMINDAFGQDDLYVEMTFLRTMEQHGLDCSIRQAGIDFANSGYPLWCANDAGRRNLRDGVAPPDSSHPRFNRCPNDIDYQIEADFSGLIAPGMPNVTIALGERFGRLMNYGDGLYAGQFVGAMYGAAFFETDIVKVIEAGLEAIPAESQYAGMVRDMLEWSKGVPSWEECWQLCQEKYRKDPEYQRASNGGIDCKINGAYVLLGLLYGKGDLDQTILISCRAGQDSDCNPSSSAGVLFTTLGFSRLPERFTRELDEEVVFSQTAYNLPDLIAVCEKLARQALVAEGGRIEKDASGEEVFVIPVKPAQPSRLELSWAPGPIAESRFSEAEMAQIAVAGPSESLRQAVERVAPGWTISRCGADMDPGFRAEERGRRNVLVTHPLDRDTPCVLRRNVEVPAGKSTTLRLIVGHHPEGDWDLIVRTDTRELLRKTIGTATATNGWLEVTVDLSDFAGRGVVLELLNQPTGWMCEAGYWAKIAVETAPPSE